MAKTPNIVPLKLVVISLGLLLIGGAILVASALASKTNRLNAPCNDISLSVASLHEKGSLISMTAHDNIVHLVFSDNGTSTIVTLSRCTGVVQQRFTLKP